MGGWFTLQRFYNHQKSKNDCLYDKLSWIVFFCNSIFYTHLLLFISVHLFNCMLLCISISHINLIKYIPHTFIRIIWYSCSFCFSYQNFIIFFEPHFYSWRNFENCLLCNVFQLLFMTWLNIFGKVTDEVNKKLIKKHFSF